MTVAGKTKKVLLRITMAVAGVLGFVLLMWTPKTAQGMHSCLCSHIRGPGRYCDCLRSHACRILAWQT
jgi:hypothetical protein